ncbi:MAG: hypothetical protein Q9188_002425 [Gyalolechia gomerana]
MSFQPTGPPPGPPYPPTNAALGGLPTKGVDIPISSVFLLLFLLAAVSHMSIFITNWRRNHKFILSGVIFGFCMTRITAQVMRIAWACHPRDVNVAIAANVFTAAGVLLLFITNLIFTQRIFRSMHPRSGWHPVFHYSFIVLYVLILLTLAMLITSVIQSSFTLNRNTKRIDRAILLYGQTLFAIVAFLPIPIATVGLLIPRRTNAENFGQGRWRHKIWILLASSAILCLGASFRVGTSYAGGTRPIQDPAGYQSKACFYIFNYALEIVVVYLYLFVRVDRRFWIPNGSKGPGAYLAGGPAAAKQPEDEERSTRGTLARVETDEGKTSIEMGHVMKDGQNGSAAGNNGPLTKDAENENAGGDMGLAMKAQENGNAGGNKT